MSIHNVCFYIGENYPRIITKQSSLNKSSEFSNFSIKNVVNHLTNCVSDILLKVTMSCFLG